MKSLLASAAGIALSVGMAGTAFAQASCPLTSGNGPVKHVVYLQFDNTHYLRDRANVPSDLEQMPALLSFLQTKGTLLANDHTQLISHTANGILTSITGVYPDRHGQGVANSYDYFKPNGSTSFVSSFVYWTNKVQTSDTSPQADQTYSLINELGKNAPAPWAAFTKAGCDFGAIALADMELENSSSDVVNVFGAGSPESRETSAQKVSDFEGIAIHCALGSPLCAAPNNGRPDLLPDEPGGYAGYSALFGHKYAVPAINGGSTVLPDLLGGSIPGFPGFDGMSTKVTLAYAAKMLEAGVPVVFGYLSDAHDAHLASGNMAYGPGEAGYVQQLANYNAGWAAFFTRLKAEGIDETNTLFIVTVEEGDHFVGGQQAPANCDGVNIPCTYAAKGEVDLDIGRVVSTQRGNTTGFDVHFDMAPNTYIYGNPSSDDPLTRQLEHDMMALSVVDPVLNHPVPVMVAMADRVEQKLLHMTSADPLREPTFTPFGYEDFYMTTSGSNPCPTIATCVFEAPAFAWNHGGIQAQIQKTWFGMVGPGVLNRGVDNTLWTDHVDFRPTILLLAGINDSYLHDGRVITQNIDPAVLPPAIAANQSAYENLAAAYKQLNAPFGALSMASLTVSTRGVALTDPAAYSAYETTIANFTAQRDALATQIKTLLDGAAFRGLAFDPSLAANLTTQANHLVAQMQTMAR